MSQEPPSHPGGKSGWPEPGGLNIVEAYTIFNAYRKKVTDEDALISQRSSLMIWTEALIFALWAAIYREYSTSLVLSSPQCLAKTAEYSYFHVGAMLFCSIVGAYISAESWISIRAAKSEIKDVSKRYESNFLELAKAKNFIPELHSDKDTTFKKGFRQSSALPILFMIFHVAALLYIAYIAFLRG